MAISRHELQRRLRKLEADMPKLVAKYPDPADFIFAFGDHADEIIDDASAEDDVWAWREIDRILTLFGYSAKSDELRSDE